MSSGLVEGYGTPAAHPLVRLLDVLREGLAEYGGANAWTMTPNEQKRLLTELPRGISQLVEIQMRTLVEADRGSVGDGLGFTNTALWWAHETGQNKPAAIGALKLGQALEDHESTRVAMASGDVNTAQAAVIVDAVDALPTKLVSAELRQEVETHLVGLAEHHDPRELRILGRKVLDVLAPEIAEEHERQVLEGEEAHAAATASFSMRPDGHGSVFGRFKIPVLAAEILGKHLAAIAAPKHQAAGSAGRDDSPVAEPAETCVARPLRLGQAFVEYLETRAAKGVPKAGGIAASVVVTMTMADLLGDTDKPALLDTGEPISASEARRLACEAGIIPAVLGSPSQVLDLGRKSRFHTEPQRVALMLRDKGCAEINCDWPAGMCHVHHLDEWSKGGGTSVDNGVLICPQHHSMAHNNRYRYRIDKQGRLIFTRNA